MVFILKAKNQVRRNLNWKLAREDLEYVCVVCPRNPLRKRERSTSVLTFRVETGVKVVFSAKLQIGHIEESIETLMKCP